MEDLDRMVIDRGIQNTKAAVRRVVMRHLCPTLRSGFSIELWP